MATSGSEGELEFIERLRANPLFLAAQALLGLKLALTVLIFDPQAADAFSLVKSAAAHATSLALVALLVGLVVAHGRRVLLWSPMHVLVGALLVCYGLATLLALDQRVALFGAWRRYLGFTQMADDAVVYLAAVLLLPTRRDLLRLAVIVLASALVVVGYMFVQQLGLDPVTYTTGREIRPIGMFGQPDIAGGYTGVVAATSLGLALWITVPLWRAILVACAGLAFVAMLLTNVRGGLVGFGLGFLAVIALLFLGSHRPNRTQLVALGAAAAVAATGIVASPLRDRLGPALFSDLSTRSRLDTWGVALELVFRRPALGLGPDNFAVAYPAARTFQSTLLNLGESQNATHNWLLQIATSTGVLGLVAFLGVLAVALVLALRLARDGHPAALALPPLVAYFGQGLVTINDPGVDWIPWLCIGVVAGAAGTRLGAVRRSKRRRAPLVSDRVRRGIAGAAAVVVLGLALSGARDRISASEHFNVSESLQNVNRGTDALVESRAVLSLDPRRAEHWSSVGAALNTASKPAQASAAFAQAARIEPAEVTFWRNLALMRLLLNDTRGAFVALERGITVSPWDGESRDLLARVALLLGDPERAAFEGHLAVQLRPTEPTTYEAPVLADIRLGRLAEAEALLRNGLTVMPAKPSIQLHLLLAQVLHEAKRDAEARQEIALALAIDPDDPNARKLQQDYK